MRILSITIGIILLCVFLQAQDYHWESFSKTNYPLPSDSLKSLQLSDDNILWIGSDSGLTGFDGSTWITYNSLNADSLADNRINDILYTTPTLLLGTQSGISKGEIITPDNIIWLSPIKSNNSDLINDTVYVVNNDSAGNIWIGTENGISFLSKNDEWDLYTPPTNKPIISVNKQPTSWQHFGTEGAGVERLQHNGVDAITSATPLRKPYNLISDTIQAVLVETNGDRWYGTPNGATYHTGTDALVYTWYNTDSGLVHNNVQTIAQDSNGAIWFGTSQGVSKRNIDGKWTNFTEDSGLISNDVRDITIDLDGTVWFATSGGLSKLTITLSAIDDRNHQLARSFDVHPAYPNPFNMNTTIEFNLVSPSDIQIKIYDVNGRLVKNLFNTRLMAGNFKVNWDGKNDTGSYIASGVYYAVIASANQRSFLKLALVK